MKNFVHKQQWKPIQVNTLRFVLLYSIWPHSGQISRFNFRRKLVKLFTTCSEFLLCCIQTTSCLQETAPAGRRNTLQPWRKKSLKLGATQEEFTDQTIILSQVYPPTPPHNPALIAAMPCTECGLTWCGRTSILRWLMLTYFRFFCVTE